MTNDTLSKLAQYGNSVAIRKANATLDRLGLAKSCIKNTQIYRLFGIHHMKICM